MTDFRQLSWQDSTNY